LIHFYKRLKKMGRRKKGSNKRGGKALPDAVSDDEGGVVGEEGVYDEVDAWANGEDAALAAAVKKSAAARKKGGSGKVEMFALSGTDSDSDLELPKIEKKKKKKKKKSTAEEEIAMNDEDFLGSDIEGEEGDNVQAWGSKKKHFYGGNTGEAIATSDEDFDEDEEEEKEAKLLQERHLDRMQEEDFLDTFVIQDSDQKQDTEEKVEENVKVDLSSLSNKQLAALFRQQAPEFDGIVMEFKQKMEEAATLSRIIWLEDNGKLPAGPALEYVRIRFQLLTNYCTNIAAYLMFKSKGTNLKLHPVTGRLVEYKQILDKMESMDALIKPQVESLLERLESGEKVEHVIREEKRRQRKKETKKLKKNKQLKLLGKKSEQPQEENDKKKKKKGRQLEDEDEESGLALKKRKTDDLTADERMAVELHKAIRRNKTDMDSEEDEEDGKDENGLEEMMPADGLQSEEEEEGEDEKRGITYKIAKNKGLMPKRSKQQRNPRVKHRMKFEKAKKRRKGAVREVRTEMTRYGGEMSGINERVKKGVKIS